ncbi:UNVERIFIED_CONTAM: hypothetical protein FKN15_030622 [Acipenser sinensis]
MQFDNQKGYWDTEEQNRGKPNWEHLNEDLHVLITVEDAQNRAEIKLKRAVEEVKKLLVPAAKFKSLYRLNAAGIQPAKGEDLTHQFVCQRQCF